MDNKDTKSRRVKSVPVWLLITVALAFAVGLVCAFVIIDLMTPTPIALSTTSIISFTFTVALGAASIILASITIVLSRSAEDALIRRSDEGIKLQNDAFVRTSEVLSTIQASTGLTEKRLEDVISGRTGLIAQQVYERTFPKGETSLSADAEERLKKSLADSLKEELLPFIESRPVETERRLAKMEARQKKLSEVSQRWQEYRKAVVAKFAAVDKTKIISETRGDPDAVTMEDFWDAVLDVGGRRVALDIHTAEQLAVDRNYHAWQESAKARTAFAKAVTWRAWQDKVDTFLWVWNEDVSHEPGIIELSKLLRAALRDTRLVLLHGEPDVVAEEALSQLGAAQRPTAKTQEKAQPSSPPDSE